MLNRPKINADQRRALDLLAVAGLQDCSGATLLAHGVRIDVLAYLVRAGLVTALSRAHESGPGANRCCRRADYERGATGVGRLVSKCPRLPPTDRAWPRPPSVP